jgi:hypothetical protein
MKHLSAIFFFAQFLHAQFYYENSNQSLETRFEQQSFFFTPTYVNPYGVVEFSTILPGIVDDPLINLQLNPATLSSINNNAYVYFDYRTNKELEQITNYVIPMYTAERASFDDRLMYPFYPSTQKLSVEPAFSTAILSRPFPESMPELTLGFSYELISQAESYYPIETVSPTMDNSYRTTESIQQQSVDYVRNQGHFFGLFSGYQITNTFSLGLRIGRSQFKRDGEYGPEIQSYATQNNSSYSYNDNDRDQNYQLWDVTFGAQLLAFERITIGATVGYSAGDIQQTELNQYNSTSDYVSGSNLNKSKYFSDINRTWDHDGSGKTFGVYAKTTLTPMFTITTGYSYSTQDQDLNFSGKDNYDNSYHYETTAELHKSNNFGKAGTSGTGTTDNKIHRYSAAISMKTENNLTLSFGVVYTDQFASTTTSEYTKSDFTTEYQNPNQPQTITRTIDNNNLLWSYSNSQNNLHLPLFMNVPLNPYLSLLIGFNHTFLTTETREQSSTYSSVQERYVNGVLDQNNSNSVSHTSFPTKLRTTSTRSLLAGITVEPVENLKIHLTAIPYDINNQLNIQWLAGINILPY